VSEATLKSQRSLTFGMTSMYTHLPYVARPFRTGPETKGTKGAPLQQALDDHELLFGSQPSYRPRKGRETAILTEPTLHTLDV
jgi:hypothetical protein